jgi:small subunit ribosomal protein S20
MPNLKSAKKELRKSQARMAHNAKVENNLKTLLKKSRKAIDGKDAKAEELIVQTLKALDKAVQKGIIKKNTRDRKKSRLQVKFNQSKK